MGIPSDMVVDTKDMNTIHVYVDGGFCYTGYIKPPADMGLAPYEVRERPGVRFLASDVPAVPPARLDDFPERSLAQVSFAPAGVQ